MNGFLTSLVKPKKVEISKRNKNIICSVKKYQFNDCISTWTISFNWEDVIGERPIRGHGKTFKLLGEDIFYHC